MVLKYQRYWYYQTSLCRDGGGCLYTVIQWKTAASVLQSGNWANRPLRRKCTLYRRQQYPFCDVKTRQCIENIHGTFHIASFSPSSSNSSSPGTVAHEHYQAITIFFQTPVWQVRTCFRLHGISPPLHFVLFCVSAPYNMPPCGWGEILCGWSCLPSGWGYLSSVGGLAWVTIPFGACLSHFNGIQLHFKTQAEHIGYAWLCSRSETAIFVHVCLFAWSESLQACMEIQKGFWER